jgi:hypothetical protein
MRRWASGSISENQHLGIARLQKLRLAIGMSEKIEKDDMSAEGDWDVSRYVFDCFAPRQT